MDYAQAALAHPPTRNGVKVVTRKFWALPNDAKRLGLDLTKTAALESLGIDSEMYLKFQAALKDYRVANGINEHGIAKEDVGPDGRIAITNGMVLSAGQP